jgi:hypothetical protein
MIKARKGVKQIGALRETFPGYHSHERKCNWKFYSDVLYTSKNDLSGLFQSK